MFCIYCGSKTKIVNSRSFKRGYEKWRRHSCVTCKKAFTSRERPDLETSISVVKRSGTHEPFFEGKILISLHRALDHRINSQQDSYILMQNIYTRLLPATNNIITTQSIAEYCIESLKNFDPVGAVKYQATQTPIMNRREIKRALS